MGASPPTQVDMCRMLGLPPPFSSVAAGPPPATSHWCDSLLPAIQLAVSMPPVFSTWRVSVYEALTPLMVTWTVGISPSLVQVALIPTSEVSKLYPADVCARTRCPLAGIVLDPHKSKPVLPTFTWTSETVIGLASGLSIRIAPESYVGPVPTKTVFAELSQGLGKNGETRRLSA